MENGYDGKLAEKFSALGINNQHGQRQQHVHALGINNQHGQQQQHVHDQSNFSANNNDNLYQVMKAVEAAEATIRQQVSWFQQHWSFF